MLTKEGRKAILDHLVNDATIALKIRLFKNNPGVPDEDVTLGALTEATFDGYAEKSGIVFPAAVINGADHGETLSPTQTWTVTGGTGLPETIYGAYAVGNFNGSERLLFLRRFRDGAGALAPQVLSLVGQTVNKRIDFLSDDANVPAFGA
jgi:hypothetical protein